MRLIDADALDETFSRLNDDGWQLTRGDHKRMESVLFEMPTIDAELVIHAEWIEDGDNQPMSCDKVYCCSNCKQNRRLESRLTNYCSECGAKMDGGEDDG